MSEINTEWKELRPKIGNLICHIDGMNAQIDAKLKALQEKEERQVDLQAQIDEAYNKGIQDLYDAIYTLMMPSVRVCHLKVPSMPVSEMRKIFGTTYLDKIIVDNTPEEIINKVNQWKAEKDKEEQEFHVGDEIICTYDCSMDYNKTFIYLGRDEYWIKMFDLDKMRAESTNNFTHYRKTGKHYDAIPILVGMSKP